MNRHLYDSPEGQAIIAQIEKVSQKGTDRREACRDTFLRNIKPAAFDWLTDDERAELHALQLQIRPLSQDEARERVQAKREARRKEQMKQFFNDEYGYPLNPADEFYNQFEDSLQAYTTLNSLTHHYIQKPELPRPDGAPDHVTHAWDKAHENDQPRAFPIVWTPDGLQYDFGASDDNPVQGALF